MADGQSSSLSPPKAVIGGNTCMALAADKRWRTALDHSRFSAERRGRARVPCCCVLGSGQFQRGGNAEQGLEFIAAQHLAFE